MMKKSTLIIILCFGYLGFAQITDTGGNVGVGTTAPKEKLHVDGSLLLDVFDKGNNNGIFFRENYSAANQYNISILNYDHNGNGSTPDGLSINAFDGISFSTGANYRSEKMRITQLGYVGIATAAPKYRLDVNGTTKTKQLVVGNRNSVPDFATAWYEGTNYANIFINETSQPLNEKLWTLSTTGGNFNMLAQTDDFGDAKVGFSIRRGTGIDIDKVLFPEGNIGIGTDTPNARLDVKGATKTERLIVGNREDDMPSWIQAWYGRNGFTGMSLSDLSQPVGEKMWTMSSSGGNFTVSTQTDNYEDGKWAFRIERSTGLDVDKVLFPEGNVGIGTTNPKEKLHVEGNIRGSIGGGALRIQSDHGRIDIGAQNTHWAHIYTDRPGVVFNKPVYSLENAFSSYTSDLILQTKGTTRLVIDDNTGNVGVGTLNPDEKLHVNGTATFTSNIGTITDRSHYHTGAHTLELQNGDAGDVVLSFHRGGHSNAAIKHSSLGGLIFSASGRSTQNDMFIKGDGLVGIGTTTPDSKLTVAGKVHAQEVKVTVSAGADFVFADDYKLPKLEQLEQFVKTNKHLPEIASEKEMQQNGLLLAEMNIKLLQKVEELTLYTIQQEKQLKVQQEVNAKLEARLLKIEAALLEQD